ncbi:methionine synthase [candidate division KSB1 bacterium 4484_87]|nr:MAG: methionine synthase [candidate division KSB1 bacterium 4484_87]
MLKKQNIIEIIREHVLVFDGAMGTNIQRFDLSPDDFQGKPGFNEILNLSRPDVIEQIHSDFLSVGCDVIETNTFGANRIVLSEYGAEDDAFLINKKAALLSKKVALDFSVQGRPRFVAGSIGPGTKLASLRQISVSEIRQAYAPQIEGLLDGGVDALILETSQDLLLLKSLLVLIFEIFQKRKIFLPVIAQVTMDSSGKLLIGSDLQTVIVSLSHFPLFALGLNCSTGPELMREHVKTISRYWDRNISVMPNAGMPRVSGDEVIYDLEPGVFAEHMGQFVREFGVNIVGGCCGTTADHLAALIEAVENATPAKRKVEKLHAASSLYGIAKYRVTPGPLIIGERCNASGSKKFREYLLKDDIEGMLSVARSQEAEGAHLLDISTAYAGIDEKQTMGKLVSFLNSESSIPLMIDSTNPDVIAAALEKIAGKPIINSVNLEDEAKMRQVLALCQKYGAAVVALTIDEKGMAYTAERKLEIAKRLISVIHNEYKIPVEDIFIDMLTFTLASGTEDSRNAAVETLSAIRALKAEYPEVNTILGVSNISYGLQARIRKMLNSVFLYHALTAGLDAAILHVGKIIPLYQIKDEVKSLIEDLIFNKRTDDFDPLSALLDYFEDNSVKPELEVKEGDVPPEETLRKKIIAGNMQNIEKDLSSCLQKYSAVEIINQILLPAMKEVGDLFGSGQMQLPFVLKSAEVMKKSVNFLEPYLERSDAPARGKIILATVQGDVHDIGKNLVDIILSNNGYHVVNLGVKQPIQAILRALEEEKADAIGMSGLLVSSSFVMRDDLTSMKEHGLNVPVLLGGAALNRKFVEHDLRAIYGENVFYARDAFEGLKIMENLGSAKRAPMMHESTEDETKKKPKKGASKTPLKIRKVKPPEPPFWGHKTVKDIALSELLYYLNKQSLFRSRWQLRKNEDNDRFAESKLQQLIAHAQDNRLIEAAYSYGYFQCYSEKNSLFVFSDNSVKIPDIRFDFPRQGAEKGICLADFFLPSDSKQRDVVGFQIVTIGEKASQESMRLFENNEFQNYLFWHGFSVELAEALAEYVHRLIRIELGIEPKEVLDSNYYFKGKYRGARFSLGYSACPDLSDQKKIFQLLKPEQINIVLSENYQLIPEQSTSAIVLHHPDARYFNV